MKRILFFYFFLCCLFTTKAQDNEYVETDNRILNIPKEATNTTDAIASFIQSNFTRDKEKLRAIYRWVTYNIKYDTDSMYIFNWGADPQAKVTAALRRRKGVCENYTAIFHDIASKCNLQSFVISGYTKQSGAIDKIGHTWCAVNIDGNWFFCDPTWDEGYASNSNYFLISPALFIESHMPFDPLWQLLDHYVSKQEFYKGEFHSKAGRQKYNYVDSVKAFLKLNELQRLEATAMRIRHEGFVNDLEKNNFSYIEMKIGIIYEDRDMNLYNSAIEDLNKATVIYNDFIQYRNNQFIPEKPDAEISALLNPAENKIAAAQKKLDEVGRSTTNEQYNTETAKDRLNNFKILIQQQRDFLKQYFSSPVNERKKIFYH